MTLKAQGVVFTGVQKPVQQPARVACPECLGKGWIALWPPGRPREACLARCEQCSGFGKVRAE